MRAYSVLGLLAKLYAILFGTLHLLVKLCVIPGEDVPYHRDDIFDHDRWIL